MAATELDRRTIRWCVRRLRRMARGIQPYTEKRTWWDSTAVASPTECLARMVLLNSIADEMLEDSKPGASGRED